MNSHNVREYPRRRGSGRLVVVLLTAVLAIAGCAGGSTGSTSPTSVDMAAALKQPATLTLWSWVGGLEDEIAIFEKKYPNIEVKVVNAGQGPAEYQKLRTALSAGEGAPDVVQIEYQQVPSFTITNNLLDLMPYGANDIKDKFVPSAWQQVTQGNKVFAIPQDTGPMGMLYRQDILEKHGIAVPRTWDEFADAARKLHAADPSTYLTNLPPNEGGAMTGLLWQAGSRPYRAAEGTELTLNIDDAAARKVAGYWNGLVQQQVVAADADFTDQWYQGLANGKYAAWLTAAWGPLFLQGTAKGTAGKWRAAPLPQWSSDEKVSGNWGGSTSAVTTQSKHPEAAAALAMFLNSDPESTRMLATKQFLFPATKALVTDESFTSQGLPFYGGQQVNKVFAGISETVRTDFTWSPFQDYVYSAFTDTVGKAITDRRDLPSALRDWHQDVASYAQKQGFHLTS